VDSVAQYGVYVGLLNLFHNGRRVRVSLLAVINIPVPSRKRNRVNM